MKVSRLEKIYIGILVTIFAGIVLHAPISVGLGVVFPDFSLLIKSWKEILMVVALPLAVIIVTRRKMWRDLLQDWIIHLVIAYTLLHAVFATLFFQGAEATAAGLAIDLRYMVFFGLVYIAIKALPNYRELMVKVAVIGAFIVVGFATLQLFLPADILSHIGYSKDTIMPYLTVDKNPDYIRVNSTLRGPNPLGAYAGAVLGLLAAALVRKRLDLEDKKVRIGAGVLGVCAAIALWISYSRSALVAGIGVVVLVVIIALARKLSRRTWIAAAAVTVAIAGVLALNWQGTFVSNVLLHENDNGGSLVSSNDQHVESLQTGTDRLFDQPLGAGVGSTGSASLHGENALIIEDQYLFIAHETGWIGLALFTAINVLIFVRLWRGREDWLCLGLFASGIGLSLIGILLPVWVDDTVSIMWWGLVAIALAGGKYDRE
jgi:hypothetical protein